MHKRFSLLLVILASLILAGCYHDTSSTTRPEVDTSSINVTLQGTLGQANPSGDYTLQTADGLKLLHDGNATLAGFEGQTIKVTGQYSGNTLYVDLVELVQ